MQKAHEWEIAGEAAWGVALLCSLLALDPKLVHCHLFSNSQGPAKVQGTQLDRERIGAIRRETEVVSALLGQVFVEDPNDPATEPGTTAEMVSLSPSEKTGSTGPMLSGLSPSHNALLVLLLTRSQWSRAELEAAAAERQIMLDGAMESINEATLDITGTMLIDGYDPIYIERELLENPTI